MTFVDTATTIDQLTAIWRRLFHRSSIGIEDNFFDLGGDPPLAVELFNEIAAVSGREAPPTAIYQAPTIASLAALLEQNGPVRLSPLVVLKRGTAGPPIFTAHGLGGSVMDLFELVRSMDLPNPIYGIQEIGLDGTCGPNERIEAMAEVYLDAIRHVQPDGPYFLIGYSLGGLVALEMAQRLSGSGASVALLAMVDCYPHVSHLSSVQRVRLLSKLLGRRTQRAVRWILRIGKSPAEPIPPGHACTKSSLASASRRVYAGAYSAWRRYRPRFYPGSIKFVKAQCVTNFPDDPIAVWEKLAAEFEVETVPGDHLGVLTTHFESLAAVLSRHLRCALCR